MKLTTPQRRLLYRLVALDIKRVPPSFVINDARFKRLVRKHAVEVVKSDHPQLISIKVTDTGVKTLKRLYGND